MYVILVSINKKSLVITKDEQATSILAGFHACSWIFRKEGTGTGKIPICLVKCLIKMR